MSEKIGIVTVLYNCESVLSEFFKTLDKQTYSNIELIIIDNASTDNSLLECKRLAKQVHFECSFIENKENLGVAEANNQGIRIALDHNCSKVLLSNNDIEIEDDTISELYSKHCEENADLSVPKIYYFGTKKLWYAGGKFNRLKGTTVHFGMGCDDSMEYNKLQTTEYAPTCFMLINRDVFDRIGFMDSKFFVYYDDTDFVYRCVKDNKMKLLYVPSSLVEHKVSFSTGTDSDFKVHYMLRNRIYFARKHNKHATLYYLINICYHYSVRRIKLVRNKKRWLLIKEALIEGWNLGK